MYNFSSFPQQGGYNSYPNQNPYNTANMQQLYNQKMSGAMGNPMEQTGMIQNPQFPSVRPVTGIEEVRATTVNFDGSWSFFYDKAHNKIHTKHIDLNGLPQIQTYILEPTPIEENKSKEDYVSKKEFNDLKEQVKKYEAVYLQLMGGKENE